MVDSSRGERKKKVSEPGADHVGIHIRRGAPTWRGELAHTNPTLEEEKERETEREKCAYISSKCPLFSILAFRGIRTDAPLCAMPRVGLEWD